MPSVAQKPLTYRNIFLAASDNDIDEVKAFLSSGVDVNGLDENGYTTLHAAASYNHIELLDVLITKGGNVNLQDHDGDTPLFVTETREMVDALLGHGADIHHTNKDGKTALEHHIEEDEFPDVIAALQESQTTRVPGTNNVTAQYVPIDASTENMDGLSEDVRAQIGAILQKSQEDGVDRDQELRDILQDALIGQVNTRQKTED